MRVRLVPILSMERKIEETLRGIEKECSKELADDLRKSLHSSQTLEEDGMIHKRYCARFFEKIRAHHVK